MGFEAGLSSNGRAPSLVPLILVAGFVGTLAQILLLRELLGLFQGNELTAAVALGVWLLGAAVGSALASKWARPRSPGIAPIASLLLLLAVALPGSLLLVRSSRLLWQVGVGELLSPLTMIGVAASAAGLVSMLCGALFALAWAHRTVQVHGLHRGSPLDIYFAEALGAAAAGPIFFFVLLPWLDALQMSLFGGFAALCGAALLIRSSAPAALGIKIAWWLVAALLVGLGCGQSRLDRLSRTWQWGPTVAATEDTAYHNLVMLNDNGQGSLFADGVWWFSLPDRQTVELDVFLPLLEHPRPRSVLMIGGCVSGRLQAVLEHPGIERVDCVEPDPALVPFARGHFPARFTRGLDNKVVHLHVEDPRRFVTRARLRYDCILMAVGDPLNAGLNRFYSREFFALIGSRLAPGGIFSFGVTSGEDMMGGGQGGFLRSFYRTLAGSFRQVLVVPGDQAHLLATDSGTPFTTDAGLLMQRARERKLDLRYLRHDSLEDLFSPFRMSYVHAVVTAGGDAVRDNTDFLPACYRNSLLLWTSQWPTALTNLVRRVLLLRPGMLFGTLVAFDLCLAIVLLLRSRTVTAVTLAVLTTGAIQMIFQILALVGYQILVGHLYTRLALIISSFMAGLAVGTAVGSRWADRNPSQKAIRGAFITAQLLVGVYPLLFLLVVEAFHGTAAGLPEALVSLLFCVSAGIAGAVGGAHFALAALSCERLTASVERLGGRLYALDIAGATLGALAAPLIILPVIGLIGSIALLSFGGFLVALVLWGSA